MAYAMQGNPKHGPCASVVSVSLSVSNEGPLLDVILSQGICFLELSSLKRRVGLV